MQKLSPKKLFMLDGGGALLSAVLLGGVLPHYESFFGMPATALYLLAAFPILFLCFDVVSYFRYPKNSRLALRMVAGMNLGYCLISVGCLIHHYPRLTKFGLTYFFLELLVVVFLAVLELKMANKLQ